MNSNTIRLYRFKDLIDRLNSKEWKVHKRKGEEKYVFIPVTFR